ncbi:TetR/AcrR family transcriptional regulator C-terminal domain-containing protein [Rhodococcus sp. NPDC127530]|uniref:TetR/AcrR family transcriptional regulator C-terminal domain-containing protein n=1 Tax=unclassified Rhodococcus (in: high G+C Gram-positive bacteria) TaxID=192944 RepID=UPI0036406668
MPTFQAALDAGQESGPRRVQHALADAFARLDASGLLRVDDPRGAAHHFAGVAAFLDRYRARAN